MILLTGSSGFIGKNLASKLKDSSIVHCDYDASLSPFSAPDDVKNFYP